MKLKGGGTYELPSVCTAMINNPQSFGLAADEFDNKKVVTGGRYKKKVTKKVTKKETKKKVTNKKVTKKVTKKKVTKKKVTKKGGASPIELYLKNTY